jgi:class III poly(R)-hydroxyalkanoic acid synthase PhaE subunit
MPDVNGTETVFKPAASYLPPKTRIGRSILGYICKALTGSRVAWRHHSMKSSPFAPWANQLLEYQRTYRDAWQALVAQPDASATAKAALTNPWTAALEQWWNATQPNTPPPVQDFYTRLLEQGKVYMQMANGLNAALQQVSAAGESSAQWQESIASTISGLQEALGAPRLNRQGAANSAVAFWELPLNTWQRAVSSSSILPGDFLQHVNLLGGSQVRDEIQGRVDQLLSTPAIGYMRENQEQTQILIKLIMNYQQALQDYAATYGEIGVKCVDVLQQHVQQRVADGNPVRSLRELYDLWVDSCEEAYVEYVSTDDYREIYGRLVNSLMAVKRHGTMMVDEALGALNMPTRAEVDTLHRRLQETRRAEKALRAEVESLHQACAEVVFRKRGARARHGDGDARSAKAQQRADSGKDQAPVSKSSGNRRSSRNRRASRSEP